MFVSLGYDDDCGVLLSFKEVSFIDSSGKVSCGRIFSLFAFTKTRVIF